MENFVYRNGSAKVEENVPLEDLPQLLRDERNIVCIDLDHPTPQDEEQILANIFNFHPLTIEDCRLNHSQPKIEEFPDYLYFIVHGILSDEDITRNFATKELDGYLGRNFVVTYHHEDFQSIDAVKRQLRSSPIACQRGAAYLLHQILDHLVDQYAPVIDDFEGYITNLEDRIFGLKKANNAVLAEIVAVKRNVMRLRRVSTKELDILYRMSHGEFKQIEPNLLPFYRDVYDHLMRVSDLAESYRDLTGALMDTYLSIIANRTNDVMKVLTVFSAMILPLTLIAGIYGMNFDNMPELHTKDGYFAVLGIMGLVAALMFFYFWRKGWVGDSDENSKTETRKGEDRD